MTNESENKAPAAQPLDFGVASPHYKAAGWLPIPLEGKVVKVKGATGGSSPVAPEKIKTRTSNTPMPTMVL